MDHMFDSPLSLISGGLPLTSQTAAMAYREIMIMMSDGLVELEQRPGHAGHLVVFTTKGLEWYTASLHRKHERLLREKEVLKKEPGGSAEYKVPVNKPGTKRFRDLKAGDKFQIQVGDTPHRLKFCKVNDAEEDNAISDSETPENCSFPEDQLVFSVS